MPAVPSFEISGAKALGFQALRCDALPWMLTSRYLPGTYLELTRTSAQDSSCGLDIETLSFRTRLCLA